MTDTSLTIRLDTTQIRTGIADLNSLDQSSLRTQAALRQMGDTTSTASQRMIAGMSGASSAAQIAARSTFEATGSMTAGMSAAATATQLAAERMSASLSGMASTSRASMSSMTESIMHNMQQMNASISQLVAGLHQSQNAIRETGAAAGSVATGLNVMNLGALAVVYAIAGIGKGIFDTNRMFEDMGIRAAGVFGSMEAGAHALQQAMEYDAKSPFDLSAITSGMINLRNFGIQPTKEVMQAFLDTAAKSGQGTEGLNSEIMQMTQAFGKGKLQMVDMHIMMQRGLPVMEALQNVTGKNTAEIMKMSEAGTMGKDVIMALILEMGRLAKNSGEDAMNSFTGAVSNLSSEWQKFQNSLIEDKLGKIIRADIELITTLMSTFRNAISNGDGSGDAALKSINEQIKSTRGNIADLKSDGSIGGNVTAMMATVSGSHLDDEERKLKGLYETRKQILSIAIEQNKAMDELDKKAEEANKEAIKKDPESTNYAQITKDKKSELDKQIKDIQSASDQKIALIKLEKEKIDAIYANDKSDPNAYTSKINSLEKQESNVLAESLREQNDIINKGIADIDKNAPAINVKVNTEGMDKKVADFVTKYGAAAEKAAQQLGTRSSFILAQIAEETGYGRSIVPGTNNLGNIKLTERERLAGVQGVPTVDNANGTKYLTKVFDSLDEYFDGYVKLIKNRRYKGAIGAQSIEDFATGLQAGGYAENPNYVKNLSSINRKMGGTQVDDKAHFETQKVINDLVKQRIDNENKLALVTGKATVEQIKNNAELKKTLDTYKTDPTEIYRLAIDDLNKKHANGVVIGVNYQNALDKINDTYYKASEAVSKNGSAMDKYAEAQNKANTYLSNTGDAQGWLNLINKAAEAYEKADPAASAFTETLKNQAKAQAELAGLEQTLSNTTYLVDMAEKLKLAGATTEDIKKQIDLQQQVDKLKSKNPLIDESKAKSIITQNEAAAKELDRLTGKASTATETAFKRAQENIQDGFATMFENMLNGDALGSFDKFIKNITGAFNKAIAQDFSKALGSLFNGGTVDWSGIFTGVVASGAGMLVNWLSQSPEKSAPTVAQSTTNKNIYGQAQMSIADTGGRGTYTASTLESVQRFNSMLDTASSLVRQYSGQIASYAQEFVSTLVSDVFGNIVSKSVDSVTNYASSAYESLASMGSTLMGGAKSMFTSAYEYVSSAVSSAYTSLTSSLSTSTSASASASTGATSSLMSVAGSVLAVLKLGYDLYEIAGQKYSTTIEKVSQSLSTASMTALVIPVVGWIVAAALQVVSGVVELIDGEIGRGISSIFGGHLGSLLFDSFFKKDPSATVLSHTTPDTNARTVKDEAGDYVVSSGGRSGTVGVQTAFGMLDMRINEVSKKGDLMIDEAVKSFLPLIRTVKIFDDVLAASIREVDKTFGQDTMGKFKIKSESEMDLGSLDTSKLLTQRLTDIAINLEATGTKAGETVNTWFSAFSQKLLKTSGSENTQYNTATLFNIESFIALELPKLVQLPKKLADLFVSSVKSVADGATQEEFTGQMNDFFSGWEIAKSGLQKVGVEIQDTALPDYLTSLVGIGMTVKQSAESLVVFANTFDTAAGDVTKQFNAAFDNIFSNAKAHAYNKEQTSGYIGSYITLANTAKDTGLSVNADELNSLATSLNTAAIASINTANGVIDQAIATANLGNISRDAAVQQLALAGTITSEQIAAADFGKALVEQQKTMLGGIEFANQNALMLGTSLSGMGLTFTDVANIGANITGTFKDMAEAMAFLDSVYKNAYSPTDYAAGKKAQASATFDTSAKALGLNNYTTSEMTGWVQQKSDTSYTAELLRAEAQGNTARATALRNLGASYNTLTQAETNYTEAVKATSAAVDDSADKAKALSAILDDVNEQLLRLSNSDVANGILDINKAIKALVDSAAENGGAIANIEELRTAKLNAYAKSLNDQITKAFDGLGKNQINAITDEAKTSIKTINDELSGGLIDFATSVNLTAQVVSVAMSKVKDVFKSVNDDFVKFGKTDIQNQLDAINSDRKTNNDLARTWLYTQGGGRNASDENMALYDGQIDRNNAVAASRTQAIFKPLIDEFNNIGKTDFQKSASDIKSWYADNFAVAKEIATAYGTTTEQVISGLNDLSIARAKLTFKPLLDEFNAIGKSDYQKNIAGINEWFNDTVKSVGDIALTYKITTEQALAGIEAIKKARLDALQKENIAATKKITTDASRLNATDFEKTIFGIADTFSASITSLAASGGTYSQIMTQYNAAIATGSKAYSDAQKVIRDAYTATLKTISDTRNTLSDELLLARGSIVTPIEGATLEQQDKANQLALDNAQKSVENAQKERAVTDLQSADFQTQISAVNTLINLNKSKYASEVTFIKGIQSWIDKTKLSESLNPISNLERMREAQRQYEKNLAGANSGDQTSKDNLTSSMDAFLTESRAYNGVSAQYFADYDKVMNSAKGFAGDTTTNKAAMASIQTVNELQSLQVQLDKIAQQQSDKQHTDLMKLDTSLAAIKAGFDKTISEDPNVQKAFSIQESFKTLGDDFKSLLTATFDDIKKLFDRGTLSTIDIDSINAAYANLRDSLIEVAETITFSPALRSALSTSLGVATTSIQATVNASTIPDNLRVGVINGVNNSVSGFMSVARSATFTEAQKTTIGSAYQGMWQGVNTVINNATATTAQKTQALSVINNASVGLGELIKSGTVSSADITKLSGVVSTAMQGQATDWTTFFQCTTFDEPTKAAIMGAVGDIGTSVIGIGKTAAEVISATPINNAPIVSSVNALMDSVASSVSAASSGVASVVSVATTNNNDAVAKFNMAYAGGNYDAAAKIAASSGFSKGDMGAYVNNTFGSGGQAMIDLMNVKGYATGGSYQGGLAMVGENGPELINFDKPGQVYTAPQTRQILSGGDSKEVVAEIKQSSKENVEALLKVIMTNAGGQDEMIQELKELKLEFEKLKREMATVKG